MEAYPEMTVRELGLCVVAATYCLSMNMILPCIILPIS